MPVPTLSSNQAYLAMYIFLTRHWKRGGSGDIAALLGAMSLLPDGRPADPAFAADWDEAVELTLSGSIDARLQLGSLQTP